MNEQRALDFLLNSFLAPYLSDPCITDISFNGSRFFIENFEQGRAGIDLEIEEKEIYSFVKQIANLSGKNFSYSEPIIDLTIGNFRFNAVYSSVARFQFKKTMTFSLRIHAKVPHFDPSNISPKLLKMLTSLVNSWDSILIYGHSGCGKTELQKYLISLCDDYTRLVIIDNLNEIGALDYRPKLDITYWLSQPDPSLASLPNLIKNALRVNPDRIILAEGRGSEMNDILDSALSGHPTIVTIHTAEIDMVFGRIVRMCLQGQVGTERIYHDVCLAFHILIEMAKETSGDKGIERYIRYIYLSDNAGQKKLIYRRLCHEAKEEFFDELPALSKATNIEEKARVLRVKKGDKK